MSIPNPGGVGTAVYALKNNNEGVFGRSQYREIFKLKWKSPTRPKFWEIFYPTEEILGSHHGEVFYDWEGRLSQ